jgi:CBS-domain-containing membrane protein
MSARVRDVMTTRVVAVRKGTTFKDIVALLTEHRVSALPVLDDQGEVVGVVILNELLADPDRFAVTVSAGVVTLEGHPETTARGRDLVAETRHVEGVVSVRDRLTYLEGK